MRGNNQASPVTAAPHLTPRQMVIVFLMGAGHTTPEIAKLLGLRPRTVENHKRQIYRKLGVGSQNRAVIKAISLGLLEPSRPPARAEPGRATLVLLLGPPGDSRDDVARLLVSAGMPFVTMRRREPLARDHWARWHRGPMVSVLVDPEPADWSPSISLGAPAVVVRSRGVRQQAAIADALAHRVHGLIAKDDIATGLSLTLGVVSQGMLVMSWRYAETLVKRARSRPGTAPELTARERDILGSIALGHTIRQTARALGIAAKTVENTQARLFRKLGARNRLETLTIADGWGLIDRPAPPAGHNGAAHASRAICATGPASVTTRPPGAIPSPATRDNSLCTPDNGIP